MRRAIEIEFERMAQSISEAAADVVCSPAEYRDGLAAIIATLSLDLEASKESEREDVDEDKKA